jgi:hypothetical protein
LFIRERSETFFLYPCIFYRKQKIKKHTKKQKLRPTQTTPPHKKIQKTNKETKKSNTQNKFNKERQQKTTTNKQTRKEKQPQKPLYEIEK